MEEISSYSYSTKRLTAKTRPPNVGTSSSIPDILCSFDRLERNNIVAWTTLDDNLRGTIGHMRCCQLFGPLLVLPCFWPHAIVFSPCLLSYKLSQDRVIRNTYWVLTTTELKVIVTSHDGCCGRVVEKTKSFPLDRITNCGTSEPGSCWGGLTTIYVDTAARRTPKGPQHEAIGHGLAGNDWFASEILSRRDSLRFNLAQDGLLPQYQHSHHLPQATVAMDRGNDESAEIRLQTVKDLHSRGILSDVEYEKKRQEIISSL